MIPNKKNNDVPHKIILKLNDSPKDFPSVTATLCTFLRMDWFNSFALKVRQKYNFFNSCYGRVFDKTHEVAFTEKFVTLVILGISKFTLKINIFVTFNTIIIKKEKKKKRKNNKSIF